MGVREKAKALFKTKSRSDSLSHTSSNTSERWPSNVYKPGEVMPRPKYRAIPKKEHKDKLEAFSFAEAWRRKSFQSQYSPMGTRAPSRRNSVFSLGRKSGASRSNSVTSHETGKSGVKQREGGGVDGAARRAQLGTQRLSTEVENENGDDDVANVGLSRMQSHDKSASLNPQTTGEVRTNGIPAIMNTAHDHQTFTEEDLALAIKRTHLAVPTA
nr:hypothetical protein CFP56_67347 [Quercus suber]